MVFLTANRAYWEKKYPVYVWSILKRAVLSISPSIDSDKANPGGPRRGLDENIFLEIVSAYHNVKSSLFRYHVH